MSEPLTVRKKTITVICPECGVENTVMAYYDANKPNTDISCKNVTCWNCKFFYYPVAQLRKKLR